MFLALSTLLKQLRKRSIRTHLILLVLLTVLPMLGIIVYSGFAQWRHELAEARIGCEQIVDHIAQEQENLAATANVVLRMLAQFPKLKERDTRACDVLFAKILKAHEEYVALTLSAPDGRVLAAAANSTGFSVADRKYFRDALATGSFAVGEYVVARSTGQPTLHYARPVLGNDGKTTAIIALGANLRSYQKMLGRYKPSPGAILTVTDHAGTILHSSLDPDHGAGKPDSPELRRRMMAGSEGSFTIRNPGGSKHLYVYRALRLTPSHPPYLHIRLGLPESEIYGRVHTLIIPNLVLLGVAALIAVGAAWLLGKNRIMRRVGQLVDASRRLAGGDLQATCGIPYDEGELGEVARSFDEMGRALARQEAERSRAVQRLHLTQYAIDHVSQAITWIDPSGTRVYANNAFSALTGYAQEELVGQQYWKIGRNPSGEGWADVWKAVKAQGTLSREAAIVQKSGDERQVEITFSHINFSGREFLMASVRDITAERQAEERLRQAQKMEAIGTLAGGIAHDFNNLLTGILGYAGLLTQEAPPGSTAHEAGRVIEKAAERAAELTRQLLGFARKGKFLNTPFKIHPLIGEVVSILGHTLDKGITITQRLNAPEATLVGDPNQIQQVILNLAVNARDAMPGGGRLTIETALVHLDEAYCHAHPQATPGQYVMIAVSDTGMGIPKELQARIFEPFFTTKEKGKGTGMGLAMVYGIIKNHHGSIGVYSEEGRGARFCIYLPTGPGAEVARHEPADASTEAAVLAHGRILLVDDEELVLDLCRAMLEKLGCQVRAFADSAEAARHYAENSEAYDLVIMDMIMPGMDGRECFRAMKRANPAVRAILSSGYSRDGRAQEILDEGMLGFIQKPYHMDELAATVAAALSGD